MKQKNQPLISVILPVYNCERYLPAALESVLLQSYERFELVLVDDGSTDGSSEIIKSYSRRNPRIAAVKKQNSGIVDSLNYAVQKARGDILARIDADDVMAYKRLELQCEFLVKHKVYSVIGSFVNLIDERSRMIGRQKYPVSRGQVNFLMRYGTPVCHPATMIWKDALSSVGGYRDKFQDCEDYDLWLRMLRKGFRISNIRKYLTSYRIHDKNISQINLEKQADSSVDAYLCDARESSDAHFANIPDRHSGPGSRKTYSQGRCYSLRAVKSLRKISNGNVEELQAAAEKLRALSNMDCNKDDLGIIAIRISVGALRRFSFRLFGQTILFIVLNTPMGALRFLFWKSVLSRCSP